MNNLYKQLKNKVRSITEPCDDPIYDVMSFYTGKEYDKKYIPKLEVGCEVLVKQPTMGRGIIIDIDEDDTIAILFDDTYPVCSIKAGDYENLGKELLTREVLMALSKKGIRCGIMDFIIVYYSNENGDFKIEIPLDKNPKDYPEEVIKQLIEILK